MSGNIGGKIGDHIMWWMRHQENGSLFKQQPVSTTEQRCDRRTEALVEKRWSPGGRRQHKSTECTMSSKLHALHEKRGTGWKIDGIRGTSG
jgi:hypothetical protein